MKKGDVIYYSDELNDDFAGTGIDTQKVEADFPFLPKGFLWRKGDFIAYYLIAIPAVFIICAVFGGMRFENRREVSRLIKKNGGRGVFLYSNHTHWLDAFVGPLVSFPYKAQVLVSPDTVSIKGLRTIVQMLGAIPVPSTKEGARPFTEAIEARINQGRSVMIFPEAHIWPYCTTIRNFKAGSFRYPTKLGTPVLGVCVGYRKRRGLLRFLKTPARIVTVSRPFYPDASLPAPYAKQALRDEVYAWLVETAERTSDYAYVTYVRAEDGEKSSEK